MGDYRKTMERDVTNREIATGLACIGKATEQVDSIEQALDAAERRGKIATLEWVRSNFGNHALPPGLLSDVWTELERLRAEQAKEER